jgi:predicted HTH transcriptional regulator
MKNEFVQIDLHIHTPSSSCYKGPKEDNEYLEIIKKAKELDLKIIALTDHNSISAYKKIFQLKSELERNKLAYEKISDSAQVKKELSLIQSKLDLFNGILILPGIEFEVSNGVHVLIIFNNKTPITKIDNFLFEGGYEPDQHGAEVPTKLPNWDIIRLLEETKKYDCLVIDAHTDSDKGILNVIPKGKLRANCFCSDQLLGVCYKSEKQKDALDSTIKTSKDYHRKSPLAFVKFSDAHHLDEIGKDVTWVKLKKIDYYSLKEALRNPLENVSIEFPEVSKILNKLINQENSFGIEDLSDDNLLKFKQLACALNNSQGGYCLFGINERKNKIGLPLLEERDDDKVNPYIDKMSASLSDIQPIEIGGNGINIYEFQKNKIILIIHIKSSKNLVSIKNDNKIYLIEDHRLISADAKKIQSIIEERQLVLLEAKVLTKIRGIEDQSNLIKNYFYAIPIIKKFESNAVHLSSSILQPKVITDKYKEKDALALQDLINKHPNGQDTGNVLFLMEEQAPRLDYAYLRITPPVIGLIDKTENKKHECIYVAPGGAVYYSTRRLKMFSCNRYLALEISSKNPRNISNKFIAAFLKSSFWIWYCLNKYDGLNIFPFDVFVKILIPRIYPNLPEVIERTKNIETLFGKIIDIEQSFLSEKKSNSEHIGKHNDNAELLFSKIDSEIYAILGLSEEEIKIIETGLKGSKIYPFAQKKPKINILPPK